MGRKKKKDFWDSLGSSVDNVFSSVGELASDAFDEANKFAKKTTNNATNFLDAASLVAGDIAEDIYKDASKQFKKTSKDVSKVFDKTMKVGTSIADSVIDSTVENAVPVIKETVGAAKGFIIVVFDVFVGMLTRVAVRREVKQKCPDAFKVMIRKKKINAVNVGIFDNKSHLIADNVEMKATEGVADEIKVGQTIYL